MRLQVREVRVRLQQRAHGRVGQLGRARVVLRGARAHGALPPLALDEVLGVRALPPPRVLRRAEAQRVHRRGLRLRARQQRVRRARVPAHGRVHERGAADGAARLRRGRGAGEQRLHQRRVALRRGHVDRRDARAGHEVRGVCAPQQRHLGRLELAAEHGGAERGRRGVGRLVQRGDEVGQPPARRREHRALLRAARHRAGGRRHGRGHDACVQALANKLCACVSSPARRQERL